MNSPIHPFPNFAPIGGLPFAVAALLLPDNVVALISTNPVEQNSLARLRPTGKVTPVINNVIDIASKKPSSNDNSTDLTLA